MALDTALVRDETADCGLMALARGCRSQRRHCLTFYSHLDEGLVANGLVASDPPTRGKGAVVSKSAQSLSRNAGSTWPVPVLQGLVQGTCGQRPDRGVDVDDVCGGSGVAATAGPRPVHARDGLCVSAPCWPDGAARCPRGLRGCAPHGRGPPCSRACSRCAELARVGAANGAVLGPPRQPIGWPHLSWPTVCPGQPRPDRGDQLWRGGCRACGNALGAGCRSGARRAPCAATCSFASGPFRGSS